MLSLRWLGGCSASHTPQQNRRPTPLKHPPPWVGSSSHTGRTLLLERSKLFKSHWSNQWLTSNTELHGISLRLWRGRGKRLAVPLSRDGAESRSGLPLARTVAA